MEKQPAFQFYPADWLQDTRSLSLSAKGAWIDLLCAMWRAQNRGKLTLPMIGYARLIGATAEQAKAVIDELTDMQVCNIVTERNGNITLINRRMVRENSQRISNALRLQRWRNKQRNDDVTPASSSSSSSSNLNQRDTTKLASKLEGKEKKENYVDLLNRPSESSPNGFDSFWNLHPGPKGPKQDAIKAYKEVKPPPEALEAMKNQIRYKTACDRRKIFFPQLPHLHRWFRKRRWEDELPAVPESQLSTAERLWLEAQREKEQGGGKNDS